MRGESIVSKIKLSDEQVQQLVKAIQDIDKTKNATPKIHCQYCGSTDLTLPMSKDRGFLVAAERHRLTSSFLIGRTPS